MTMKIGVFGGTFNPIHRGHLAAASAAAEQLSLDKLLLIPDAIPPHKPLPSGSAGAEERLEIFSKLPIRHKNIICQPMISAIDLEAYLDGVELVIAGGESDRFARPMDYAWVLSLREQCVRKGVPFEFRQCGTHFLKDGREYTLQKKDLCSQARKANINYHP